MSVKPLVTRTDEAQKKEADYILMYHASELSDFGNARFYLDEENFVTFDGQQLDMIRKFIHKAYEEGGDHMRSDMLERYGKL